MAQALVLITAILQLLPALINAIKAIEEAIPGEGKGELKLAAIRQILEVTSEYSSKLWPTLEKVIGVVVSTFNTTGVFNK
jgi:hypothetical protein